MNRKLKRTSFVVVLTIFAQKFNGQTLDILPHNIVVVFKLCEFQIYITAHVKLERFQVSPNFEVDIFTVPCFDSGCHNIAIDNEVTVVARLDHDLCDAVIYSVSRVCALFKVHRGHCFQVYRPIL